MRNPTASIALLVLTLAAAPAFAQERPATTRSTTQPRQDKPTTSPVAEKLAVTEHEMKVDGGTLKYKATAGTVPMKDEAGKLKANFFFVAYEKHDQNPDTRPITFVFNGGPGAASIWLHLGTVGPKRIDLQPEGLPGKPPYRLVDNPTTWLNQTDLVFIDPVGTGYSRPAEGVKGEEFFGVQQDIDSVSEFIRLYLTRAQRWSSPKFLAGESYGTTRGSMLAFHLNDRYGIDVNGVVLISVVLSFQTLSPSDANELPFPLFLPTYTAAAHYHKKLPDDLQKQPLPDALAEVQKWVTDVYQPALFKGEALQGDDRKRVLDAMARYTGLPATYIDKANLRVTPWEFEKMLLNDERLVLGRFDARITGAATDLNRNSPDHDPSLSRYVGVYSGTFNGYIRGDLKFESDLPYEYLTGRVQPWNWGRQGNGGWLYVGDELTNAIIRNPHLKVLFCSGVYDLATPYFATDYTIGHLKLTPDLRKNIRHTYYEGGHMMYHHQASLEKLNKDVAGFMKGVLAE